MERNLTAEQLELFEKEFASQPTYRLMQNAVTQTAVGDVALDRRVVTGIDHSVSHLLDDWKVTNQKKSGRCWLFAGLNLLRVGAAAKLGVKDFEFSQNYLLWWDKFERSNFFLEAMIETGDRDVDDRTVAHLLSDPIGDGGQWNMFVALVRKHGLVPKSAMPETESSSNTAAMNDALRKALRQGARDLRKLAGEGADAQRKHKRDVLGAVHRVLSIHLGTPPRKFLWQWKDEVKNFHRGVPGQRDRRAAGGLPERRDGPDPQAHHGRDHRWRAGMVRLRRGQADARRPRLLGREPLRLRVGLRHEVRAGQGRAAAAPRDPDDARDAVQDRKSV